MGETSALAFPIMAIAETARTTTKIPNVLMCCIFLFSIFHITSLPFYLKFSSIRSIFKYICGNNICSENIQCSPQNIERV